MYLFFQAWWMILQVSAPAILLMLLTIWRVRKSNPIGYQMGWGNIVIFILYSLFFASIYQHDSSVKTGSFDDFLYELLIVLLITPAQLLLYWIGLFMVKPSKKAKHANISKALDEDDPLLDEQPPTK